MSGASHQGTCDSCTSPDVLVGLLPLSQPASTSASAIPKRLRCTTAANVRLASFVSLFRRSPAQYRTAILSTCVLAPLRASVIPKPPPLAEVSLGMLHPWPHRASWVPGRQASFQAPPV